jgi:hypothetical protein
MYRTRWTTAYGSTMVPAASSPAARRAPRGPERAAASALPGTPRTHRHGYVRIPCQRLRQSLG